MPKNPSQTDSEAFGSRLVALLAAQHPAIDRHGAGAYLSTKYKVSTVTANDWLNGKFKPGIQRARRIAEDHGASFDELYFGKSSANPSRYRIAEATGPADSIAMMLTEARGSCGGGSVTHDDEEREPLMKEPSWFRRYKLRPENAFVVWADGDSMSNFIVDGDIVIFDRSKTTPRTGQIFLIEHPDGLRIKQLRREIDGTWVLESLNPDKRRFPDERVSADDASLLKVRGEFVYRQGG